MKLTIIRLQTFSEQDKIDLAKIWPEYSEESLDVDDAHLIYAARFNDRLLGAARVTLSDNQGAVDSFRVRDVTRRRGVGKYLLEEILRLHPEVFDWWVTDVGVENYAAMNQFMLAQGFTEREGGWHIVE